MTPIRWGCGLGAALAGALALATAVSMRPLPVRLDPPAGDAVRARVVDRRGERLAVTYENRWNLHDRVDLHEVPALLRAALVEAEDRRFFDHSGVDWTARAAALVQNLRAGRVVRGASTITEQVVRMLHPRPRTLWSRWVEGFEAMRLERRFSKGTILTFYLNQVPYARQRHGIANAARDLFDRDLETLDHDEILALAVLVRSPSRLDPRRDPHALRSRTRRLAGRLAARGALPAAAVAEVGTRDLELREARLPVSAPAFVRYARERGDGAARLDTTLDARLQARVQSLLDRHVAHLADRGVGHGAALVVDHRSDEILVWANARTGSHIDAVRTPRQPGSTLKPFVYALALEGGWTAATLIDDSPLGAAVGTGLHRYRNYSGGYRGPLRLRVALASSLNVPAVRAMQSLPAGALYGELKALGFDSLAAHPDHYGEGLALGNGEVTLLELVRAYAVLARGGVSKPLRAVRSEAVGRAAPRRHFDLEVATLVADILADDAAREPEFGRGGPLDLPVPAAVKTGTSNDYRDAWALGFGHRYTAGVWMGDLDRRPTEGVTGAVGPAVVLRAIFAELHRFDPAGPLPLSRRLRRVTICADSGARARPACPAIEEWFRPAHAPTQDCALHAPAPPAERAGPAQLRADLVRPTHGLRLALDPRIPDALEVFEFALDTDAEVREVEWIVDGEPRTLRRSSASRWEWPLSRGPHRVRARVHFAAGATPHETREVPFFVR